MQSFVRSVNSQNYESFVTDDESKNKILLFTDKKNTAPLFKSISKTFKDKMSFGEVRKSEEEAGLFVKFGITATPTLMALTDPLNHQGEVYDTKEMKIDQLKKWLSNHSLQTVKVDKAVEFVEFSPEAQAKGVCGKKSSTLCVIVFDSQEAYKPLLERFKNDPVTMTYASQPSVR